MIILNPRIQKAMYFTVQKHCAQVRKGTSNPYSVHPISVGCILMETMQKLKAIDYDVIVAGLLHDTLEDTETTEQEILDAFGEGVLKLVVAASEDDRSLPWKERKMATIEKIKHVNFRSLLVPLADKIHNLYEIEFEYKMAEDPDAYWNKYNAGKTEQMWVHSSIIEIVKERLEQKKGELSPEDKLVEELVNNYTNYFLKVFE